MHKIKLTRCEEEVCQQIIKGLSNKQIAFNLGKSESTVKLQINSALQATGAFNRTGLAMAYLRYKGILKENANDEI